MTSEYIPNKIKENGERKHKLTLFQLQHSV